LGDWVYDFQNAELDTLRLRRTPYEYFRYVYSVLENRTVHIARMEIADEIFEALRSRFNERYLIQNKHFSVQRALRNDRDLLRSLRGSRALSGRAAPREDGTGLGFRGAAFFYADDGITRVGESAAMGRLRAGVEAQHGKAFLPRRIRELERTIAELDLTADGSTPPRV
jgi:hypothetical protein